MRLNFLILIAALTMACSETPKTSNTNPISVNTDSANSADRAKIPEYTYEIVNTYPHDPKAFTQGLVYHNGFLYEGTGGSRARGDDFYSTLRKVEIESGKVLQNHNLPDDYFGEGITILGDKIYQLTWREKTAFVYDLNDFKLLREFRYAGEGWGLTDDGTNLIMSDGTHIIRFVNPENFETLRTIAVMDERGRPQMNLNELELIKGEIWANVWEDETILRIDPASGKILGKIDMEKLAKEQMRSSPKADVLNGIAYDEAGDRIFVTGKRWSKLFEIKVVPKK
jgi:glutaminyl-peptide cyclotransferase